MSKRKKVYGFLFAVILLIVLTAATVHYFSSEDAKADAQPEPIAGESKQGDQPEAVPVELTLVEVGDIDARLTSTGNLRAAREVEVVNRTDGQVTSVLVEEGDVVAHNQLLAEFDDTQHQISLLSAQKKRAQAKLQLEKAAIRRDKARTQITNTTEEYQRYQKLYDQDLVSEREVAQLRYQIDELTHDERISDSENRELTQRVEELQAEIARAQLEISRTKVRAPFGGHITSRTAEVGRTFRNLDPLFKLADFDPLYADVFLSEMEALQVRAGLTAEVQPTVEGGKSVQGRVERVSPIVDQATGTVKITVEVPAHGQALKPGAFALIAIKVDTHRQVLLVPKRAVLEEDGSHFVFVAQEDSTARRVEVELGYRSDTMMEIRQGIEPGDQIVTAGQGALDDGAKIRTTTSE